MHVQRLSTLLDARRQSRPWSGGGPHEIAEAAWNDKIFSIMIISLLRTRALIAHSLITEDDLTPKKVLVSEASVQRFPDRGLVSI